MPHPINTHFLRRARAGGDIRVKVIKRVYDYALCDQYELAWFSEECHETESDGKRKETAENRTA